MTIDSGEYKIEIVFEAIMSESWSGVPDIGENKAEEIWIEVEPEVSIRVLIWKNNDSDEGFGPVVMVPGWGSLFQGWKPLVSEWVKRRSLIYIETREKGSSRINKRITKDCFSVKRHGKDISEVLNYLEIDHSSIDWFSSSLGSTVLIDSYQRGDLGGRSSILLAPNYDFKFPLWARSIIQAPLPMLAFRKLVGLVAWAVDKRTKEEGQKIRYRRALLSQDVPKMLMSARANLGFSLPSNLSSVEVKCAVMTASSDTLHDFEKIERISNSIPGCKLIEVPSNQYAHEAGVLSEIEQFHRSLA